MNNLLPLNTFQVISNVDEFFEPLMFEHEHIININKYKSSVKGSKKMVGNF